VRGLALYAQTAERTGRDSEDVTPISGFVFVFVGDDVAAVQQRAATRGRSLVKETDPVRANKYIDLKGVAERDDGPAFVPAK
jgi:hypothetical protein